MTTFYNLFPAFMLAFPAVFTLFVKRHPELSRPDGGATRRLWLFTAIALLVHAAVQTWFATSYSGPEMLPRTWPLLVAVGGNMFIWFRFAMPVLASRQPGWRGEGPAVQTASPVRTASLVARDRQEPVIGRTAWIVGWGLFAACTGVIIWAITQGAHPLLCLGLGFWLGMGVAGAASTFVEPEPLDPEGSTAIIEAYAKLRAFRQWGFYGMGLAGTLVFTGIAVLTVYVPQSAGLAGGIAGSVFGVLGGVFGTMASIYRVKVNNAVAEAHADEGGGAQVREGAASG